MITKETTALELGGDCKDLCAECQLDKACCWCRMRRHEFATMFRGAALFKIPDMDAEWQAERHEFCVVVSGVAVDSICNKLY